MLKASHSAVLEALSYLELVARDQLDPQSACMGLDALRARHPDMCIDLVWQEQEFDGSMHYDALIRGFDSRTFSVSVCPDRALPWPLRGVQKSKDSDLLRVNGMVLPVGDALARLDVIWRNEGLMQTLVDACLVEGEIRARGIRVDAREVQAALNGIRERRGLLRAADMHAWMRTNGIGKEALEEMARDLARTAKLREVLVGAEARVHLEKHAADFDCISYVELRLPEEAAAQAAVETIHSGAQDFYDLAARAFAEGTSEGWQPCFRRSRRYAMEEAMRRALEQTLPGCTIGPVAAGGRYALIKVLGVDRAGTDERALEAVRARLFRNWLEEQRCVAQIEWFWGKRSRTAVSTGAQTPSDSPGARPDTLGSVPWV